MIYGLATLPGAAGPTGPYGHTTTGTGIHGITAAGTETPGTVHGILPGIWHGTGHGTGTGAGITGITPGVTAIGTDGDTGTGGATGTVGAIGTIPGDTAIMTGVGAGVTPIIITDTGAAAGEGPGKASTETITMAAGAPQSAEPRAL